MKNILQVLLELFQSGDSLRRGFQDLLLVDEYLFSIPLDQRPKALAHSQPNIPQNLKAIRTRHQKGKASVAKNADGLGKTIKCFEFKAGEVELLKLLGRIHGKL